MARLKLLIVRKPSEGFSYTQIARIDRMMTGLNFGLGQQLIFGGSVDERHYQYHAAGLSQSFELLTSSC